MSGAIPSAVFLGSLEYRQRGRRIVGTFPYLSVGIIADRGTVRKERFKPGAFRFAIEDAKREINLLVGHEFGKPLASKTAGSLSIRDTRRAVEFEAKLPQNREEWPTWTRDAVLALDAGLMRGISPGFRVPPASAVPDAETLVPERGNPGVMIREISEAVLFELSLVTRAVYEDAQAELRAAQEACTSGRFEGLDLEAAAWL